MNPHEKATSSTDLSLFSGKLNSWSVHENRIKENIDIFDFSLTEEEKQELAARDENEPIIGKPKRLDFTEVAMTWGDNETDSKAISETSPTNFRKHFRCESQ